MGSFLSNPSWWVSSRRVRAHVGQAYREFVETEKENETWETCMGEAFLMPHTECAHRQAQTRTSLNPWALQHTVWSGPQGSAKGSLLQEEQGHQETRPIRSPGSATGEGSTTHHNLYPQFGVQSRNVNSSTFCLCPFTLAVTVDRGLQGTCTQR